MNGKFLCFNGIKMFFILIITAFLAFSCSVKGGFLFGAPESSSNAPLTAGTSTPTPNNATPTPAGTPTPTPVPAPAGAPVYKNVTPSTYNSILSNAQAGDVLLLATGNYTSYPSIKFKGYVTIKAAPSATPVFTAGSGMYFTGCNNLIFDGLNFSMSVGSGAPWVKLMGCKYTEIKNCHFYSPAAASTGSVWIYIGGDDSHDNRVSYNIMENKTDTGKFILFDGNAARTCLSLNDIIDHNIFRNTLGRQTNESEPIRLGVSDLVTYPSYTVVEYNTFERCDSDPEIVSVKSCDNIIRYNIFKECLGTVCIRQAFRTNIYGNYFIGNGRTGLDSTGKVIGTGGVRIYSNDHKVYNNYFEGLTGTLWDAAITMTDGDAVNPETKGKQLTSHFPAKNCIIANNTFVNNLHNFELGFKNATGENVFSKPITNVTIANNIIVGSSNELLCFMDQPSGGSISGNIMLPQGSAVLQTGYSGSFTTSQINVADPLLTSSGSSTLLGMTISFYKPSSSSPAINAAIGDYSSTGAFKFIVEDIDREARVPGLIAVGADEYR